MSDPPYIRTSLHLNFHALQFLSCIALKQYNFGYELYFICFEATSAAPKAPTGDILDVGTPFYQDGRLQVHVYWQTSTGTYQCTHTQCSHELM